MRKAIERLRRIGGIVEVRRRRISERIVGIDDLDPVEIGTCLQPRVVESGELCAAISAPESGIITCYRKRTARIRRRCVAAGQKSQVQRTGAYGRFFFFFSAFCTLFGREAFHLNYGGAVGRDCIDGARPTRLRDASEKENRDYDGSFHNNSFYCDGPHFVASRLVE